MFVDILIFIISSPFKGAQVLWSALTTDTRKDERARGNINQEIDSNQETIPEFDDYDDENDYNDYDTSNLNKNNHDIHSTKLRYVPEEGYIGLDEDGWWVDEMMVSLIALLDQVPNNFGAPHSGYSIMSSQPYAPISEIFVPSLFMIALFVSIVVKKLRGRDRRFEHAPIVLNFTDESNIRNGEEQAEQKNSNTSEERKFDKMVTAKSIKSPITESFQYRSPEEIETSNLETSLKNHFDAENVMGSLKGNAEDEASIPLATVPNQTIPDELIIRKHRDTESSYTESPILNQGRFRAQSIVSSDHELDLTLLSDEISKSLENEKEPLNIPDPDFARLLENDENTSLNELDLNNILGNINDVENHILESSISQNTSFFNTEGTCLDMKFKRQSIDKSTTGSHVTENYRVLDNSDGLYDLDYPLPANDIRAHSILHTPEPLYNNDQSHNNDLYVSQDNYIDLKSKSHLINDIVGAIPRDSGVDSSLVNNLEPLESDAGNVTDTDQNRNTPDTPVTLLDSNFEIQDLLSLDANTSSPSSSSVKESAPSSVLDNFTSERPKTPISNPCESQIDSTPKPSPSKIPVSQSPHKRSLSRLSSPRKKNPLKVFRISDLVETYLINRETSDIDTYLNLAFGSDIDVDMNVELLEVLTMENIDDLLKVYSGKETSENWKARHDNFGLLIGHLKLHLPKGFYDYFQEQLYDIIEDILEMAYTKRTKLLEKVILFIRNYVYYSNGVTLDDELYTTLIHLLLHVAKNKLDFISRPTVRSLCLMIQALNLDSFKRCFHMIFDNILSNKTLREEKYHSLLIIKFYLSVNFHYFTKEDFDDILDLILPYVPLLTIDSYQKTRAELAEIYLICLRLNPSSKQLAAFYDRFPTFVKSNITKPNPVPANDADSTLAV
ncbi:hypothetical protein BN7_781 [Wickerhamomyces ciferrii]|uniref:Protein STU1 n=1 Tax=Wickerhamomyces ciferrii (strain ATCC 14091 / BCRC 22168 / CBS 111 / JCM 3599 / NBRC 0793 / NRRL Y-1031 F-60-10) TaxID=1206466 RepID=K0KIN4_WICCF|nr:uncharacterized protein BN7_781 [Wickerhamomyces ciferrii]CCH41244.1 hypothetical protein BN7_781 [Wickerhamomyces ciferrii]